MEIGEGDRQRGFLAMIFGGQPMVLLVFLWCLPRAQRGLVRSQELVSWYRARSIRVVESVLAFVVGQSSGLVGASASSWQLEGQMAVLFGHPSAFSHEGLVSVRFFSTIPEHMPGDVAVQLPDAWRCWNAASPSPVPFSAYIV